jgi:hypothetical protein
MRSLHVVFSLLVFLFIILSSTAMALDLSGQSRTYLFSRETTDSTRLMPLYEYLDFRAEDPGSKNLSFHFGGWYRYDLQNESFGTKSTGDLQYAYLSYRGDKADAFLNLGRVIVNQGVASEQVDGVAAGTDLKWGFGISAFGGLPVETAFDTRTGDSVYGGRISQGGYGLYRIGVSYLLERNNSTDFRKEEGLDLWFRPVNKVELNGASLYNALTSASARHAYYLTLGPFSILTLRTEFTEISYKDFFTSTTMSAFQLQPGGPIDPNEKLKTIGEEALLTFGKLVLSVDYKKYNYDLAGDADYYGGRLTYAGTQNTGAGLSLHRMDGQTDKLRYYEYRLYGYKKFEKTDLTVDVLTVSYDTEISGVKNAYSASIAGGYVLTAKAKVGADIEYAKNPYYNTDVRGLVKLVYNFDFMPDAQGRK